MRCIIAGSRSIDNRKIVWKLINNIFDSPSYPIFEYIPKLVLCGMAKGVDLLGKRWAEDNKISIAEFPANWDKYGRRAGYIRNEEMVKNADALIVIWDGVSRGTEHMIDIATQYNLHIDGYIFSKSRFWRMEDV